MTRRFQPTAHRPTSVREFALGWIASAGQPGTAAAVLVSLLATPLLWAQEPAPGQRAAVAPEAVFFVDALGATPDDASDDDRPSIQAAIDAAIHYANTTGGQGTVLLSGGGEYRLKSGKRGRGYLDFSCASGWGRVTLAGEGATLIVETPRLSIFFAEQTAGIRIENVVLDLDRLPHIGCIVSAVDVGALTVTADPLPGSTRLAQFPGYSDEWGWLHDREVWHRPKSGVGNSFHALERLQDEAGGPIVFTLGRAGQLSDFEVGDVLSFHYRRGNNFRIQDCHGVELDGVISYGAGLFFLATHFVSNLSVRRCAVLVRPGRVQATNGDGVHLKYGRRIEVTDCYFEGLGDDAVNISASYDVLIERNEFRDKRRHAIVLDTDGVAYRSLRGSIRGNVVSHNGGSFIYHDGGEYGTFEVAGNRTSHNNLSGSGLQAQAGPITGSAMGEGAATYELGWEPGGQVVLTPRKRPQEATDSQRGIKPGWTMIRQSTPRGTRWRLEADPPGGPRPWLYLTCDEGGQLAVLPSSRSDAQGRPGKGPVDAQVWIRHSLPGGAFLLEHELSARFLGASLVNGVPAAGMAPDRATAYRFRRVPN